MVFKNSLKILFGKGFFLLCGPCASFLARLSKPAWPASPPAARLALLPRRPTSPRPSPPARCLLLPRAAPDRVRHAAPRGERMPATPAGWCPMAPASKRASPFSSHRSSASPCAPHFSLLCCLSASPRTELRSRRHRHRSPAGKICRRCSTIALNRAHIALPRSPTPSAHCKDTI